MKTIVYLTINTINKKIYVGVHDTNTDKFDGYLGNGVYENDNRSYERCKTPFHFAVKKYGIKAFKRITLKTFDDREDALEFERQIVNNEFILRKDTYNIALGGGDPPKWNSTKCYQYDINGNYINSYDSYTSAALSVNGNSQSISHCCKAKTQYMEFYWSNIFLEKLKKSEMKRTENNSSKKVYMYNFKGNFIKEFDSIISVSKELNETLSMISNAIYGGSIINDIYLSFNKENKFIGVPKYNGTKIPIYQYSLEGIFIKGFESTNAAAKSLSVKSSSKICIAIKNKSQSYGYLWSKEKLDRIDPYNKTRNRTDYGQKQVGLFNLEGVLVKKFDSFKDCYCEYPGFKHCLDKNRIAYKQYYFKTLKS